MDDEASEAAVLSAASYNFYRNGYDNTQEELEHYGLGNFHILPELSDDHSTVILRPDGKAVVSYRGTDAFEDIIPDLGIAFGAHNSLIPYSMHRFEKADQKLKDTQEKYDVKYLTGHSLGGAQAISTARKNGLHSITFNPGSSPIPEATHAFLCSTSNICENELPQTIFTTGKDPISYSSYLFDRFTDDIKTIQPKDLPGDFISHSLTHFMPERQTKTNPPDWMRPINMITGETFCDPDLQEDLCPKMY